MVYVDAVEEALVIYAERFFPFSWQDRTEVIRSQQVLKRGGMITRSLAPVLVILLLSPFLLAQTEGGNCDLSVIVRTSDERSIETQMQVDVLSPQGLVIATAHIVGAEAAQFRVF